MDGSTQSGRESGERLIEIMRAYRASQVLITCTRVGVFEALGREQRTSEELAGRLALPAAPLTRLLNAATALEFLEKNGNAYRNSSAAFTCLTQDGPFYLGNLIRRENAFFTRWSRLEEAVRTGQRPPENRAIEDAGDWVRGFEYALYDLARVNGPAIAEALTLDPGRAWKALDLGGGHGGYSIALAQRYPRLEVIVMDLPPVIEVTREIVSATDVEERVHPRAGDFMQDDLGSDYDLVLLLGVLVSEPPDRRATLLRRSGKALKPGGLLVIRELVMDDDGAGPIDAALFDLNMLLSNATGGAVRVSDLVRELAEAGFEEIASREVSGPGMAPLWLARRGPI